MTFQSIAPDVKLGKDVKIYDFVNLYGCEIGDESKIGTFVEIQRGARIGRRVKISSHTFICEGVQIEDQVFIGHGVTFINDKYPRATTSSGELQSDRDWTVVPTVVRRGASIGSGSTILCGVEYDEASRDTEHRLRPVASRGRDGHRLHHAAAQRAAREQDRRSIGCPRQPLQAEELAVDARHATGAIGDLHPAAIVAGNPASVLRQVEEQS